MTAVGTEFVDSGAVIAPDWRDHIHELLIGVTTYMNMHGGQSVPFEGMLQLMTVTPWPPITLLAAELFGVKIQQT